MHSLLKRSISDDPQIHLSNGNGYGKHVEFFAPEKISEETGSFIETDIPFADPVASSEFHLISSVFSCFHLRNHICCSTLTMNSVHNQLFTLNFIFERIDFRLSDEAMMCEVFRTIMDCENDCEIFRL